ncbi:hypothetical protein NBO_353g0002 [Nosema bombycis CQ1]|uniref:Uncharacterized protein n=1 Tax=Nosema bombycis (strain CQ1 / CVCC 102059) TaxID=578461 RepID=R0MFF2_NOSB1|nr:hypothetical protein NBO_353g0002 [Nosema bombycis CQ1]|eukprot:EOB12860.1 hypothetical protein NBO_353g0002 [Nosema bombycis CQ1]
MKKYQIVEILRTPSTKKEYEFVCLVYNGSLELKKAKTSLAEKLRKGEIFKGDFVIIKDETSEGVDMEVCEEEGEAYDGVLNYVEYIYGAEKYLPFLNDTLPYCETPIESVPAQKVSSSTHSSNNTIFHHSLNAIPNPLIGKVVYKTRINYTNLKYYFFMILQINNELLKVFIWRENIKYSALKVGDIVGLQKYRVSKGYQGLSCLDYNRFSEAAYFDTKEVTGIELVKFDTEIDCKAKSFLPSIEGFISYKSVLTRRNHGGLDEYYLLVVNNEPVVLFFNSDLKFYEIEAGNYIKITI